MGRGNLRRSRRLGTVDEARRRACRRVPRIVFDYIDGGAGAESTMRANIAALEAVGFEPRMGVTRGIPGPDVSTTVLGRRLSMPVVVGPVGFTRVMEPGGDVAGARAAGAAGTGFVMSSMSAHTPSEVSAGFAGAAGDTDRLWFQLYPLGGRRGAEKMIDRAAAAGFSSLVITVDTQIHGNRERDVRNRVSMPLRLDARTVARLAPGVVARPRWLLDAARDRFRFEIKAAASTGSIEQPVSTEEALVEWALSPLRWDDFPWIRERWPGPLVVKGVLSGDDARRAVDAGASAVVVSNHGGRQLDGMAATMPALVEVVDAVGDRTEVLVDGGIRRGADAVKAVALGARAVLIGRAWAYGLAAAGEPGVTQVLSVLRADVDRTLRLLGCPSVEALDRSYVRIPGDW
jgi:isopentenyl diphosphate isomerase/L-lactate dehydrogenase-like FMN-dependent dehydrogenase